MVTHIFNESNGEAETGQLPEVWSTQMLGGGLPQCGRRQEQAYCPLTYTHTHTGSHLMVTT